MPKKKTFLELEQEALHDEAVKSFIDTPETAAETPDNPPMKPNPLYIETKSKRLNLLIQPKLYKELKKQAEKRDLSINELINTTLKSHFNLE